MSSPQSPKQPRQTGELHLSTLKLMGSSMSKKKSYVNIISSNQDSNTSLYLANQEIEKRSMKEAPESDPQSTNPFINKSQLTSFNSNIASSNLFSQAMDSQATDKIVKPFSVRRIKKSGVSTRINYAAVSNLNFVVLQFEFFPMKPKLFFDSKKSVNSPFEKERLRNSLLKTQTHWQVDDNYNRIIGDLQESARPKPLQETLISRRREKRRFNDIERLASVESQREMEDNKNSRKESKSRAALKKLYALKLKSENESDQQPIVEEKNYLFSYKGRRGSPSMLEN